ncbi:MAG TPA: glycerophosphodiester phosphodiesterase family protein [Methylomirabilota bacterium]|nr:glycerophosphodiester phosphodiesterase family protein [Methylomirabilota bacterium]
MTRLVLLGITLGCLAALAGSAPAQTGGRPTLFAAHRGGALLWPENSLLAFKSAAEQLGADFLEFDVHLSKDGEGVVIHDPTLDRTTNGRGPVRERTLQELRALQLRDRAGAITEERLPSLDEVVALAVRTGRRMLLEIKVDDRAKRYPGIEEKVLEVLDRHRAAGATLLMSFERDTWKRIRAIRPDVRVCALYSKRTIGDLGSTFRAELRTAKAAGVHVMGLHQDLVDAQTVELVREAGLGMSAWTVNDEPAIRRVVALGVDIVISDRPDIAKRVLGR